MNTKIEEMLKKLQEELERELKQMDKEEKEEEIKLFTAYMRPDGMRIEFSKSLLRSCDKTSHDLLDDENSEKLGDVIVNIARRLTE